MSWFILELGSRAEGADPDDIRRSIANVVRGAEVFIPAQVTVVGQNRVFHYVVEGYAFVRQDARPMASYRRLENSKYVHTMLHGPAGFSTVSDAEIIRMREMVRKEVDQGIDVGDIVRVISGPYKEITGQIIEDLPETESVQVYIKLLSKQAIVTLPRSFLELVSKRVRPRLLDLLPAFRAWVAAARQVAACPDAPIALVHAFEHWAPLAYRQGRLVRLVELYQSTRALPLDTSPMARAVLTWHRKTSLLSRMQTLAELHRLAEHGLVVPDRLRQAALRYHRVSQWHRQRDLLLFVQDLQDTPDMSGLKQSVLRYARLHRFHADWTTGEADQLSLQAQLDLLEGRMLDNVLIDGFNLAFRCRLAPNIRDLKDSKGRPTGLIFGFLRSLAALQKRFPKATLHVCWDGSSKRRKAAYEGYKANRPQRGEDSFDQVGFLRGFLPLIGITQHWHPDEEADDVIATLVKGSMAGQRNIILTTDRDMLQLVETTTVVLTPAVGAGKERVFDEDAVREEYGVEPDRLPQLRALTGDTSDNLPGVVRVPIKILAALVRTHGTVDKIYSSGFAGVTKAQYTKIREAEQQVRMNADLMTLRVDVPVIRTEPNPDQTMAAARLGDVDVNPETISVFFSEVSGFLKVGEIPRGADEPSPLQQP